MPPESTIAASSAEEIYRLIREELRPRFADLARCASTPELLAHPVYDEIREHAERALESPETGDFTCAPAPPEKSAYRFLAWNLERGIQFEGILEALRAHPYMKDCDVLLLTETDVGMARSGNRDVARELASELGMHVAFAPCYLNLAKGSGVEFDVAGDNDLGLHGNAILSRYPLRNVRPVHLKNGKDKMRGREKRLGRQTAVAAEVVFPNGSVTAVSAHLDANSTQVHRRDQMRDILDAIGEGAAVVGGDWNTTTYNSSSAFPAIMGFWLRVFMGPDNVIQNHYLHPYNRFERELFELLQQRGFDYRDCNKIGERTTSYDVDCAKTRKNLGEWVPGWCFAFIRWALRNHEGRCPLKIDWFAVRGAGSRDPVVFHEMREGREPPLSDHDAIGFELEIRPEG